MTVKYKTIESLCYFYRKKFPLMKIYQGGKVNLGNKDPAMRWAQFFTLYYRPILKEVDPELVYDVATEDNIIHGLSKLIEETKAQLDTRYDHLVPLIDVVNGNKKTLFNMNTHRPSLMDVLAYQALMPGKVEFAPALIEFDPYSSEYISDAVFEGIDIKKINLYSRPPWQEKAGFLEEAEIKDLALPPLVKEYFEHFIPDEECRDFVLDWMHYCLVSRCETYLVLNGAKGAGKGAFFEAIMQPLLGKQNCGIAPESALEANFNSFLDGKRLLFLDEVKFNTPSKVSKLKRYINKDQNIEKKGVDADRTIQTFNSFINANNDETDCHLEWDDRRFSVLDITKVKLEKVWSKEKIDQLYNLDEDTIEQMGQFIFYREPKVMENEFSYWRGPHFWKLCYVSLPEWAKVIVDMVTGKTQGAYSVLDIRREYKKRTDNAKFPRMAKIEDFLLNYKHEGTHYLGSVRGDAKDFEVVPSEHFRVADHFQPTEGYDSL